MDFQYTLNLVELSRRRFAAFSTAWLAGSFSATRLAAIPPRPKLFILLVAEQFRADYLARFPVAVIERGREIVAFANVWAGPSQVELSVDLMRYREGAPREVMESLFVNLMVWGKAHGYQRFSLGVAPLSGFERSPVAPLWSRFGSFLFEHGGAFYNFQGLRAYKEKFHPDWQPRYLVYPGGFRLPQILADVSALVAGGYRQILLKR